MSGVFLSYSRADRAVAEQVVRGLRGLGIDAWWDEDMPGVDWQDELARQINELAAVIVLWTPASISSKNVKDEARLGQHTEKLVNILRGVTSPPFPFDRVNGLPLDGWTGREPHNGWTRLVKTIEDHVVKAGAARPGELTAALAAREQTILARRQGIAAAEEAYQTAKTAEEAEANAAAETHQALATAEEVLKRVVEVRASGAVVRAAQADLDAAEAAETVSRRAGQATAAALAQAARKMTRARAELERMFDEPRQAAPPDAPPHSPEEPAASRPSAGSPQVSAPPVAPLAPPRVHPSAATPGPVDDSAPIVAPLAGVSSGTTAEAKQPGWVTLVQVAIAALIVVLIIRAILPPPEFNSAVADANDVTSANTAVASNAASAAPTAGQ